MIRCGKCNKSRHYLCIGGSCSCKCREFEDTVKNITEPERNYTEESQAELDKIQKEWRALR